MARLSTTACAVTAALAGGMACAQPVEGGAEWIAERAGLLSQVCMATAPTFDGFDSAAETQGLQRIEGGWHLPPEATLGLFAHDGFCSCVMNVGAPDQDAMIDGLHARLMQDWGSAYKGPDDALAAVAPFDREGVEVVSILEPRKVQGQNWVSARLTVVGDCPDAEGGA
ncbi:hypothetical protein [Pseudoponticoccus marisrubri]|uniref:Uncharacterized protein n=1 Tax=Pseudoponticoccus marisrubri TaxID=1685382 RepID=A0A0W7WF07_9RHOB|nr:hypothetical protein [Pseudoponticoccus marisrubri]KUF09076.1 hypothetical protein AVJ23_19305 [Pseudoponticoccus marisrubri]